MGSAVLDCVAHDLPASETRHKSSSSPTPRPQSRPRADMQELHKNTLLQLTASQIGVDERDWPPVQLELTAGGRWLQSCRVFRRIQRFKALIIRYAVARAELWKFSSLTSILTTRPPGVFAIRVMSDPSMAA